MEIELFAGKPCIVYVRMKFAYFYFWHFLSTSYSYMKQECVTERITMRNTCTMEEEDDKQKPSVCYYSKSYNNNVTMNKSAIPSSAAADDSEAEE